MKLLISAFSFCSVLTSTAFAEEIFDDPLWERSTYFNIGLGGEMPLKGVDPDDARFQVNLEWGTENFGLPLTWSSATNVTYLSMLPRYQLRFRPQADNPSFILQPGIGPYVTFAYSSTTSTGIEATSKAFEFGGQLAVCAQFMVKEGEGNIRFCPVEARVGGWNYTSVDINGAGRSETDTDFTATYGLSLSFGLNW